MLKKVGPFPPGRLTTRLLEADGQLNELVGGQGARQKQGWGRSKQTRVMRPR